MQNSCLRQMCYEVIRITSLHTKGQLQRRVEWSYGQWYSGKPPLQSGDINYETWFQTTMTG
jgi:hypothetical protein